MNKRRKTHKMWVKSKPHHQMMIHVRNYQMENMLLQMLVWSWFVVTMCIHIKNALQVRYMYQVKKNVPHWKILRKVNFVKSSSRFYFQSSNKKNLDTEAVVLRYSVSIGNFKHIQPIVFRGAFKSQSNIAVGTFLQLSAFELFSLKAPSSIFDWVLNVHLYWYLLMTFNM